jgi:SM-20-related protein
LTENFNDLIDSYIDNNVGIAQNFITPKLAAQLKQSLVRCYASNLFNFGGIGNNKNFKKDDAVRGDLIYWLDRKHGNACENDFFDVIDQFILHLNQTCYTGLSGYEFHYTLYPAGSFYKKHLDQFKSNDNRKYSMIIYLNDDWMLADGGQLCIHHEAGLQNIAPKQGTSVFFKSNELAHEVLLTTKPRMSITGWLKAG